MMGAVSGAVRADRAVGAVLAGAAGDALGAAYEFGPALADDAVVAMGGGGAFGWEPGEWTDDTQMALAILRSLADPEVVASGQVISAAAHLHRHGGLTAAAALDRVATELGGPKNAHLRTTIHQLAAI